MGAMASQITSLTIVYSTIIRAQIKVNIKAPRHWWGSVNSPHKWPVTRKMFPFDDVIMIKKHQSANGVHDDIIISYIVYLIFV